MLPKPKRRYTWLEWVLTILLFGPLRFLFRLRVIGYPYQNLAKPYVLVANHASVTDPIIIQGFFDSWIRWVAKKEVFQNKLVACVLHKIKAIPLDRSQVDLDAMKKMFTCLKEGEILGIFPQGTRVKGDAVYSHVSKNGAVIIAHRQNVPLLPLSLPKRLRLFGKNVIIVHAPIWIECKTKHLTNEAAQKYTNEIMTQIIAKRT